MGSEHTIKGKRHDLEMHMVHSNTKYPARDVKSHKDGLLVVGILFDESNNSKIKVNEYRVFTAAPILSIFPNKDPLIKKISVGNCNDHGW